jgi:hypothetical protein
MVNHLTVLEIQEHGVANPSCLKGSDWEKCGSRSTQEKKFENLISTTTTKLGMVEQACHSSNGRKHKPGGSQSRPA